MRDKNTINRATFDRCAKGFVFHVDCGAGMLSETYAFNKVDEAAAWLVDQFVDDEPQQGCPDDLKNFQKIS